MGLFLLRLFHGNVLVSLCLTYEDRALLFPKTQSKKGGSRLREALLPPPRIVVDL
jgi:hypothetical protein